MVTRWHDQSLHARLRPLTSNAALLFDNMERMRCESIGALQYPGVAINLHKLQLHDRAVAHRGQSPGLARLIQRVTEHCWLALRPPTGKHRENNPESSAGSAAQWQALKNFQRDQTAYAQAAQQIIRQLLANSPLATNNHETEQTAEKAPRPPSADEQPTTVEFNPQAREKTDDRSDENDDASDSFEMDDADGDSQHAPVAAGSQRGELTAAQQHPYRIYSKTADETLGARSICSDEELTTLRALLDVHLERHSRIVGRLAGRLQRLLIAQQQRHWQYDLDAGTLDTARLTRVVTDPLAPLTFRQESDIPFRATTVTLLIDNSKSMLGHPIAIAACCADLLSRTLERCGVGIEVLGFTTVNLHGGSVAEEWHKNGAHENPGRLNSLRHVIYKAAGTPYRRARTHLGLMLNKNLLKQNIDGEALLWASQRMQQQAEPRKILMVISDGAPLDVTTLAANQDNILDNHLHQIIRSIEKAGEIELVAIGIGHDVRNYYQRAITINDASRLGNAMLNQLAGLFSRPTAS